MTALEQAARDWAAADAALEQARRARDVADQEYAAATVRAFDTVRSAADIAQDRTTIIRRNEAGERVREAGRAEAAAHLALLTAARRMR